MYGSSTTAEQLLNADVVVIKIEFGQTVLRPFNWHPIAYSTTSKFDNKRSNVRNCVKLISKYALPIGST